MKQLLLIIIFLMSSFSMLNASHLCGGDMRIEQIGPNQFKIYARYVTLNSSSSVIKTCKITDFSTGALITSVTMNFVSSRNLYYYHPATSIMTVWNYSDTITLANNTNGYVATINYTFSRGTTINIPAQGALIFSCQIPNPAILGGNSNPIFVNYPDSLSFCVNNVKFLDFSSSDPDGDSLIYSLIEPVSSTTINGGRPFGPITWNISYGITNILGPGSSCSINSSTGIVSARSTSLGRYLIGVKCEEYRNGNKIGETVRDIPIPSLNCAGGGTSSLLETDNSINVSIYPNPSNGIINVNFNSTFHDSSIEVYAINSQKVFSTKTNLSNTQLDLNHLEKGVYFVRITQQNKTTTKKIVIS